MNYLRNISLGLLLLLGVGYFASTSFFEGLHADLLLGISLIMAGLWVEQILIYSYHNSYYFKGLNSVIGLEKNPNTGATYDLAEIVLDKTDDIAKAFCVSRFGSASMIRAGLAPEKVDEYLKGGRQKITADRVTLPEGEVFSIIGLGKYLLQQDKEFASMLATGGVTEEVFIGSLRWVVGSYHQAKRRERWWSKDNLSKTSSIGGGWSVGTAYELDHYAKNISTSAVFSTLTRDTPFAEEKINEIELALTKSNESNVLVLGEAGVGKIDLLIRIQERMKRGEALGSITGRQITILDTQRFFASHHHEGDFEAGLIKLLDEATLAGNNIIVLENISSLIKEGETNGVNITEILDQYLALPDIQIIATDTPANFHNHLERLGGFTRRFTEVLVDSPDRQATTRLLQSIALAEETRNDIFFTYGSLLSITKAADKYIVEGVMPGKAIKLLLDVATKAKATKQELINEDFVYTVISEKTGIPAGPISNEESDLLLHLEDKLKLKVIGQEEAVTAIAKTMRRSRAGLQADDKPIGSFLFLGPTGVGKTETAKALANIFFGGETKMQRLDMSEYSGEDAVLRLTGNETAQGALPNLLREHPYCVLLLDEFEKAHHSVHDIFLQVLDEGIFTDFNGDKVNARNCMIVATSNAGSRLIVKTVKQRKDLAKLSSKIIDHIVNEGIYKPELINRFDSVVIFEPLSEKEQSEVANLLLNELYARLKERGYAVKITPELLAILVKLGYSLEFGARPMRRILQNLIEEKIAQNIITGYIKKGQPILLDISDFSEEELSQKNQ